MTNVEIQEYVRTKKYGIFKVTELYETEGGYYILNNDKYETYTIGGGALRFDISKDIVNHSFNLIDLIEVGDYVNGSFIIRAAKDCVDDEGTPIILAEDYDEWSDNGVIYNEDIKTIVTKEQFKAMEYKVGGEDDQQR